MPQLDRVIELSPGAAFSAEAFKAWLVERALDAEVGFARDDADCPLVRFWLSLGAEQAQVTIEVMTVSVQQASHTIPTPEWAGRFVLAVDGLPQFGEWLLSAGRALKLLESVLLTHAG